MITKVINLKTRDAHNNLITIFRIQNGCDGSHHTVTVVYLLYRLVA